MEIHMIYLIMYFFHENSDDWQEPERQKTGLRGETFLAD